MKRFAPIVLAAFLVLTPPALAEEYNEPFEGTGCSVAGAAGNVSLDDVGDEAAVSDDIDCDAYLSTDSDAGPSSSTDDEGAVVAVDLEDDAADVPVVAEALEDGLSDSSDSAESAGWKETDGATYYIDPETREFLTGGIFEIEGESYCFGLDGVLFTGWMAIDGDVYYFDPETGAMLSDCAVLIQGLCAPISASDGAPFSDVEELTPHSDDIRWAYETGISAGWLSSDGARSFRPLSAIARADMAAFLYRLAGSPDFIPKEEDASFFADVDPDTPHATAVWWLARTGISEGWAERDGSRTFRPLGEVARADMAAFVYRLVGSPGTFSDADATFPFVDVSSETPHFAEISWLASTGISEGWLESDGTRSFRPYASVARADMAAFLHRTYALEGFEPSGIHEYLFDEDGALVTGWADDGSFHDRSTGALVETGWIIDGANRSYIDSDTGTFLKDGLRTIAGYAYLFDSEGFVQHGWVEVDGLKRCFSSDSGFMFTDGVYRVDGSRYCFDADGNLRTGLVMFEGATYYFDPSSGAMRFGLVSVGNKLYYFDRVTGKMFTPKSSGNVELDRIIIEMANRFGIDGAASLRKAYDWVATFSYTSMNIYPEGSWQSWSIPYAIEMYNNHTGNCYRYASLTCWFARALGYEAKAVSGQVLVSSGWAAHGWVEINQNGKTVIIDTSQHRAAPERNFFMVDYDHAPLYYRALS